MHKLLKLLKTHAFLSAYILIALLLYPAQTSAIIFDGTWVQSGNPGTTTVNFTPTVNIDPGDFIVLTFPAQATINAAGSNIAMTSQTTPIRQNNVGSNRISIATDTFVASGNPVNITMSDGLSAYVQTTYIQQSVHITHTTGTSILKDSGLAIITNNNQSLVTALVPPPSTDSDGDGVPDYLETGDRDNDGIPDYLDYDPTGYFYDIATGEIIPGGSVVVTGPGAVTVQQTGVLGYYQWATDGTPGTYQLQVTPPTGYVLAASCTALSGSLDPTGGPVGGVFLGLGRVGTSDYLQDNQCTNYYFSFELAAGDPVVFWNNFPLAAVAGLSDTGTSLIRPIVVGALLALLTIVTIFVRPKPDLRHEKSKEGDM